MSVGQSTALPAFSGVGIKWLDGPPTGDVNIHDADAGAHNLGTRPSKYLYPVRSTLLDNVVSFILSIVYQERTCGFSRPSRKTEARGITTNPAPNLRTNDQEITKLPLFDHRVTVSERPPISIYIDQDWARSEHSFIHRDSALCIF
jgi:hypothetical protein